MDPLMLMLGVFAVFIVMNLLIARPQQKKQAELARQVAEMPEGTRVMTTSGIYGTAVHIGSKQVVLEISPGVEMTVSKAAIREIVDPADDEFEYADDDAALDAPGPLGQTPTALSAAPTDPVAVQSGPDYRPETLEETRRRLDAAQPPADGDAGSTRAR